MGFLDSQVTGWGAFGSLAALFVTWLLLERIVPRRSLDRQLKGRDEAMARALAEKQVTVDFYREALAIERTRNDVLAGGLSAMVGDIRAAVLAPGRTP